MNKKDLPVIVLLIAAILGFWPLMHWLGFTTEEQPAPEKTTPSVVATDSATRQPADTHITDKVTQPTTLSASTAPARPSQNPDFRPDTIVVNTQKYRVLLSTLGGGPVSIQLKEHTYRDGAVIEMLSNQMAAVPDIRFAGEAVSTSTFDFKSSLPAGRYDVDSSLTVTFVHQATHGGKISKSFTFHPNTYHIDFGLNVSDRPKFGFERNYSLWWNSPLKETEPDFGGDNTEMYVVAMQSKQRFNLDDYQDDSLRQQADGNTSWVGVRSKYFASVLIPRSRVAEAALADGKKKQVQSESGAYEQRRLTGGVLLSIPHEQSLIDSFTIFVGPMDYDLLSDYNLGLEDILDIGTTPYVGWIIKPFALGIMWLLPAMYEFIPNYGLVIILFALLVKIITLPLSLKSFKSMAAMRDIAPKLEQLKTRFKNNPQAMNTEMLKLYKEHGVNPLSGCLPMLMQMPLFFALFSVFRSTILLRNAPFFGFISDLSKGASGLLDPYILLIVVMVGAQFLSQYLTMAPTQQNKMIMYLMPLLMGFLFHTFAAGLVLYWTMFSLFSLLDWAWFKRSSLRNPHVKTTS